MHAFVAVTSKADSMMLQVLRRKLVGKTKWQRLGSVRAIWLTLLLVLVSVLGSAQTFMAEQTLNSNAWTDTGEDTRPVVATDGNGTWIAVWVSTENLDGTIGTDSDLLFARSTNDGANWSSPAVLNSNATSPTGEDLRPQIGVYGGKWVVIWSSTDSLGGSLGTDSDILFATSSNSGIGWSTAQALNSNAASDSGNDTQPALAVDGTGVWLAAWQSDDTLSGTLGSDLDPLFARSTDAALSWSAPASLASYASTDATFDQEVDISCNDAGMCVTVWSSSYNLGGTIGTDTDILTSYSLDHGATWSASSSLKSNAGSDSSYVDLRPRIDNNGPGIWVAAWDSSDPTIALGTDGDIVWSRSTNGVNWTPATAIASSASGDSANDNIYGLANDGNGGNWIAFWGTRNWWGTDPDLAMVTSSNVALSWSTMSQLNLSALFDYGPDYYADIATDRVGHWVAVWQASDAPASPLGSDMDILFETGWGPDRDGDGLADGAESNLYGTDPFNPDSDGDGLNDGAEVNTYGTDPLLADTDGDGLSDGVEVNTYGTNPLLADTDGDGFSDADEIAAGSDPLSAASTLLSFLPTALALNTNAAVDTGSDGGQNVASDTGTNRMAVWTSDDPLGAGIGTDVDVLFAFSTNGGQSWSAPAPVNTNAASDSGSDQPAVVATDGTGTWLVVWRSDDTLGGTIGTDTDLLFARSTDQGTNWTAPVPLNTDAASDTAGERDLALASDGAGGWLVVWESGGRFGNDFDILYARSSDGGLTWTAPAAIDAAAASDSASDTAPSLVSNGADSWLVAWSSNNTLGGTIGSDSDILSSYSTDSGANWSAVAPLNANAFSDTGGDYASALATDGLGTWLAAWGSNDTLGGTLGTDSDILVARSLDLATGWSPPQALSPNAATDTGTDGTPALATDGAGSWLAVWDSTDTLGGVLGSDDDILVSLSPDGLVWTAPAAISGSATTDSGNDFTPSLATNRNGSWVTVWQSNDTLGGVIGSDWDGLFSTGTGPDRDGDGLTDGVEVNTLGTNPALADTDGDGLTDGDEVNLYGTNPLLVDTDGDGFSDGAEIAASTDPLNPASYPGQAVPTLSWPLRGLYALLLACAGTVAAKRRRSQPLG